MSGTGREQAIALLRAAADLLEGSPDTPLPWITIHFVLLDSNVGGRSAEEAVAATAGVLAATWHGAFTHNAQDHTDWYDLKADLGSHQVDASISTHASGVASVTGTHAVSDWAPNPAIAALLESAEDESEAGQ